MTAAFSQFNPVALFDSDSGHWEDDEGILWNREPLAGQVLYSTMHSINSGYRTGYLGTTLRKFAFENSREVVLNEALGAVLAYTVPRNHLLTPRHSPHQHIRRERVLFTLCGIISSGDLLGRAREVFHSIDFPSRLSHLRLTVYP